MKQIFTFLFLSLFTSGFVIAQSNFKKGFVVTTTGDTLKGFIDQQEWIRNPHSISYKSDLNAGKQEFTPENSKYFELEAMDKYEQFILRISMDRTDLEGIAQSIDTSKVRANLFLKVEQQGKNITLYSYTDKVKTRYFIKEVNDKQPQELVYRRYRDPHKNQIGSSNIYRGQLWFIAQKNQKAPNLKKEIEKSSYNLSDLLKVVSKINGYDVREYKNMSQEKPMSRFFAGVGLNKATIDIRGDHNLAKSNPSFHTSNLPKYLIGADAFINPNVQRLILRGELSFTNAKGQITKTDEGSVYTSEYIQTVDQQNISFTPQIIYNIYNGQRIKFYIGGGIATNLSSYSNINYKTKSWFNEGGNVLSDNKRENSVKFNKVWYNFPLRSGIMLANKIDLSVLYFVVMPITKYINYSYNSEAIHIQTSYLFNKRAK